MPKRRRDLTPAFVLLLGIVAALCVLAVILLGAQVYRGMSQRSGEGYGGRTCVAYIASRLRSGDAEGAVAVAPFGDGDALLLTETIDGADYVTSIYVSDGWLCELYAPAGLELGPESGAHIAPAESLTVTETGGALRIVCETDAGARTLLYAPRSGGDAQ